MICGILNRVLICRGPIINEGPLQFQSDISTLSVNLITLSFGQLLDWFLVSWSRGHVCEFSLSETIHGKKKDGGYTFYHNTLQTKLSPLGIYKDMV